MTPLQAAVYKAWDLPFISVGIKSNCSLSYDMQVNIMQNVVPY